MIYLLIAMGQLGFSGFLTSEQFHSKEACEVAVKIFEAKRVKAECFEVKIENTKPKKMYELNDAALMISPPLKEVSNDHE